MKGSGKHMDTTASTGLTNDPVNTINSTTVFVSQPQIEVELHDDQRGRTVTVRIEGKDLPDGDQMDMLIRRVVEAAQQWVEE